MFIISVSKRDSSLCLCFQTIPRLVAGETFQPKSIEVRDLGNNVCMSMAEMGGGGGQGRRWAEVAHFYRNAETITI